VVIDGSVNPLDYKDAIICIKSGQYETAANYMVKEALGNRIHPLTTIQRTRLTNRVAKKLKVTHHKIHSLRKGEFSADEIADEAYLETVEQLGLDAPDLNP
jgi:hypothetical protein